MDVLSHSIIFRPGTVSGAVTKQERHSVDFTVNGESLLDKLVKSDGGHADFMGCMVLGFPEQNAQAVNMLVCVQPPDSESGRVLFYVCPECGDLGCGAYGAFVERTGSTYVWRDFAYENGCDDPRFLTDIGPFVFESTLYESEVLRAGTL